MAARLAAGQIAQLKQSTDRVVTIINSLKNAPDASKNGLQEFLDVAEVLRYLANQLSSSGSGSSSSSTSTTSLPDSISELVDLLNAYAQELTATKSEPPFSSRERTILEAVNGVVAAHAYCLLSEHVLPSAPAASFAHLDFTVQLEHDSVARRLWGEKFGVEATHAPWPALSDLIVSASGAHAPSPAVLALLQEALDPGECGVVSVHKFAALLRLLGSLGHDLTSNAAEILGADWFFGLISFQDANTLLARQPAGSFLFRWGSWQLSSLVACIAMPDHSIQQAKITYQSSTQIEIDGKRFASLAALRQEYKDVMTRPMKAPRLMVREFNPSISFAECTALLTGLPVGSYLVRLSAGRPGDYVLAVKKPPTGEAVQIIVQYQPASLSQRMPGSFLLDGVSYPSLAEIRARNSDLLRESLPLFLARHLSQCAPLSDRGRREAHLQLHIRRISQRSLRAYNQGFAGNAYNFGIDEPLSPRSSSQAAALAYGSIRHSGDEQSFFTDAQPPASTNNTAAMAYGSDPGYVPIARPSGSALDTNDSYVLPLATDANTSYVISPTKSPSTSSTSSSAGEAAASPRPQQQPIGIGALHHGSFSSLPAGVTVTSSTPVRAWLKGLDLEKLANLFEREELYDLESISDLSREDIQDMVSKEGLTKGALSRLFRAVTQLKDPRYLAASGIGQGASASQPQLDYTYSTTTQNPDAAAIMAMAAGATASPPPQPSPQQGGGDALRSSHTDMKETFVSDIQLKERVGHGFFGVVYRGLWQDAIDVALKQVSRDDAEGVKEFEAEVAMLLALRHPNVIRFYGIYAASLDTQYMVLEWANGGSLYSFISDPKTDLSTSTLVRLAVDAARGMMYLSERSPPIVHRDLALRNLLLEITSGSDNSDGRKYTVKVADFGLSRFTTEVDDDEDGALAMYCPVKHRKPLPVRWLAPEAWYDKQFSWRSDVWAFGVTLWELFSGGAKPYDALPEKQIMKSVAQGLRPKRPLSCPDSTFDIAQSCWNKDPAARPTFRMLYNSLREELLRIEAEEKREHDMQNPPSVPAYDEIDPYAMLSAVHNVVQQRAPSPEAQYKFDNDDDDDDSDDGDDGGGYL